MFGLGEDVPMSTANLNDGLVAVKDGRMILLRVPYPLGVYAKGRDGRPSPSTSSCVPIRSRTDRGNEGGLT